MISKSKPQFIYTNHQILYLKKKKKQKVIHKPKYDPIRTQIIRRSSQYNKDNRIF